MSDSPHSFSFRVYYEDTDFSGNVYHAAYLKFFERARTEWLRARDIHHSELVKQGLVFAVRQMDIWFDAPARIDDELLVETRVASTSGARIVLEQSISCRDMILTRATVTIAMLNASGRATRLPPSLRSKS